SIRKTTCPTGSTTDGAISHAATGIPTSWDSCGRLADPFRAPIGSATHDSSGADQGAKQGAAFVTARLLLAENDPQASVHSNPAGAPDCLLCPSRHEGKSKVSGARRLGRGEL